MTSLLATLIEEFYEVIQAATANVERELEFPKAKNIIKVAIGMRRAGKSCFLYQIINKLLAAEIAKEQILFINFEDERLLPMTAKEMGKLIDEFYTLYPENHDRCCYIFLDEVHNVTDWSLVVRRYFDSKNVQLYLSGSSAKLLSKEIASSLRGRSLAIEVWPYSFKEYLAAKEINMPEKPFGKKAIDSMQKHLFDYFNIGGFPGVQHLTKNEWRDTLQNYVDTVILRDIVERYSISNIVLLKYLISTMLKNAATIFSVNKFFNDIKSQGYNVSKDTLHLYISYLEDAFLIFTVPFYTESERIKQNRPKKIYAIDNGLVNANSLCTTEIINKFFENQIYLDLRRQQKSIYYYHTNSGYEIDFVVIDKDGTKELIQVCLEMHDPKTIEREQRALSEAEKELGIKGKIITLSDYLQNQLKNLD